MARTMTTFTIFSDQPKEMASFYSKILNKSFARGVGADPLYHTWLSSDVKLSIMKQHPFNSQPYFLTVSVDNLEKDDLKTQLVYGPTKLDMSKDVIAMMNEDLEKIKKKFPQYKDVKMTDTMGEMSMFRDPEKNTFALVKFEPWMNVLHEAIVDPNEATTTCSS